MNIPNITNYSRQTKSVISLPLHSTLSFHSKPLARLIGSHHVHSHPYSSCFRFTFAFCVDVRRRMSDDDQYFDDAMWCSRAEIPSPQTVNPPNPADNYECSVCTSTATHIFRPHRMRYFSSSVILCSRFPAKSMLATGRMFGQTDRKRSWIQISQTHNDLNSSKIRRIPSPINTLVTLRHFRALTFECLQVPTERLSHHRTCRRIHNY